MSIQRLFLTFFGTGLVNTAPGTVGTLAALPVGVAILHYFGLSTLFLITISATVVGIVETNKYEKETGIHDDKHIVIDEAVGIWITIMLALSASNQMTFPYIQVVTLVLSFLTFRLFDIWKPSTIGTIDKKLDGGLGVMLDDVLAGIAAGVSTVLLLKAIQWGYTNLL